MAPQTSVSVLGSGCPKSASQIPLSAVEKPGLSKEVPASEVATGALIVNADDWGRDRENTERTRECILRRTVSSVSAMVFMEDSERAASIAHETGIDSGLHLNFTTPFSAPAIPALLLEHQRRTISYLRRHPISKVLFHPGLRNSFEFLVRTQLEEFEQLYGRPPARLDGHHHMHLCANVLFSKLLPAGTVVRRNFSFTAGEKSFMNRYYRRKIDEVLIRRHRVVDFMYSLMPLSPERLSRIAALARRSVVEVETHPVNAEEHRFLINGGITAVGAIPVAARFAR